MRGDDVELRTSTRFGLILLALASIAGFYVGGIVGFFLSGVLGPGSMLLGAFVVGPLLAMVVGRWVVDRLGR
jgi:hypothetical protein